MTCKKFKCRVRRKPRPAEIATSPKEPPLMVYLGRPAGSLASALASMGSWEPKSAVARSVCVEGSGLVGLAPGQRGPLAAVSPPPAPEHPETV
jgi:hypothetical protein